MLRNASEVIFVDPHFSPEDRRYRRPLEEFLRAAIDARPSDPPRRLEVHSSADKPPEEFFRDACNNQLPRCVPVGLTLRLVRLRRRGDGERLHNRYILTNLGGVIFGVELDEGDVGDSDDVHLLERDQYEERWRQYASENPAFDLPETPLEIVGTSRSCR